MSFLSDLAAAHQKHEGWYPGSVSWKNNNPGNLRLTRGQTKLYGAQPGYKNFARFPTYEIGFQALMDDLRVKITGGSQHIDYRRNPTFLDYVRVYAPSEDGNNPHGYAQALIQSLPQYHIRLDTPLSELAKLITGKAAEQPKQPQTQEGRDSIFRTAVRKAERIGQAVKDALDRAAARRKARQR